VTNPALALPGMTGFGNDEVAASADRVTGFGAHAALGELPEAFGR
jgi:hypothetical protein